MGIPSGKQDQYTGAFGAEGVEVVPLLLTQDVRQTLESLLMLFFIGSSRESTLILKHQRKSTEERGDAVTEALKQHGLKRMNFRFDQQGAIVFLIVANFCNLWVAPYIEPQAREPVAQAHYGGGVPSRSN